MDDLIRRFNEEGVRYLVLGGQAVRLAGFPRFSMDWDFWIPSRDMQNIDRINRLLADDLDLPLLPLGEGGENFVQTYQTRWGVVQFHLGGPGLAGFAASEQRSVIRHTESGTPVRCLCDEDLLAAKRAANRAEDQADIRFLEEKLRGT